VPEAEIDDEVAVVSGTDGQKMSKSYGNTIDIFADKDTLRKQVMSIVTDPTPVEAPKDPDRCSLFAITSLFLNPGERDELRHRYVAGGLKYSDVKKDLVERIWQYFTPYREHHARFTGEPDIVSRIMKKGADTARAIAQGTIAQVREKTGLAYWCSRD
jgi:tryptophanyl-tRNA synthetase